MFRFRLTALGICLLIITAGGATAKTDRSAAAYKKAAESYYKLIYSPKKFPRQKWMEAVNLFKDVYINNPRGKKSPDALFMTGRIYQFMYLRFGKNPDKENAVTIFRVLVRSYPFNSLSDDALFRTGELHAAAGNDGEALAAYTGLLKWFPTGDMAPEAKKRAAELRRKSKKKSVTAKKPVKRQKLPEIRKIRYWNSDSYTRVVLDLSKMVNYRLTPKKGENVLTVDLVGTRLGKGAGKTMKPPGGPVQSVSVSSLKGDIKRVNITLKHKSSFSTMELSNPPRIVLDIYSKEQRKGGLLAKNRTGGSRPAKPAGLMKPSSQKNHKGLIAAGLLAPPKLKPSKKTATPVMKAALVQPSYGVKTIVIDPGHGGKDPGAVGRGRLKEKNVVLDIGKRLRKILLRNCGCRVLMTRNRDVFVPLEERTALANTVNADLFISIHVNANESHRVRGAETYFLSPAKSKREMYTAARENMLALKSDDQDMNDLAFILSDMKNTDKINESSKMASRIQKALVKRVSGKYKLRNNGVKTGMFYVLHGARMPSVLVEAAFITNRQEEKRLRSPAFRERIAQGIADGVKNFVSDTRLAMARR
jgi:N-acetylmuramoyl-L-alanine amidase